MKRALKSFFGKGPKEPSSGARDPATGSQPAAAATDSESNSPDYGDRKRAEERYTDAYQLLKKATERNSQVWGRFEFDDLQGEPAKFDDALFKSQIHKALDSRQRALKDYSLGSQAKRLIESIYTALSPLAKNFLMVATNAQSV